MTKEYKIALPKLGESIVNATIVQWFKKEGDPVRLDEPLLEVSTDKVNSEIPSPVSGTLQRILFAVDAEVEVGQTLAIVELHAAEKKEELPAIKREEPFVEEQGNKEFLSPSVLRLMQELRVSLEEVQKIRGSGAGGRVTKQDVEEWVEAKNKGKESSCFSPCQGGSKEEERIKMTGMRKAIAENMVKSFYEAPHATLIHEVDVTPILQLMQKHKESFQSKHGVKLTVTSFVMQALTKALQEFPLLNASLEADTIVMKKYINLGVAVSVDQGLMVPVVKHCQKLCLLGIAKAVQELSAKARNHQLLPDDVMDGTMSVTNFGMSGVSIGVPIIRYPEVAILGIGAIKKRLQVLQDDMIAIRSMLYLSLTFDHRVIDGMYGCAFLSSLQKHLEEGALLEP